MAINWLMRIVGARPGGEPDPGPATSNGTAPPPAPLIDADETLVAELTRARRYEHALTIVVVSVVRRTGTASHGSASNGNGAGGSDGLVRLAAAGLREALRESDVVCYRPTDGRFVLGIPQSDGEEARQAMARVGELFNRRLHMDLVAGAASFPADGLTLVDLESQARERMGAPSHPEAWRDDAEPAGPVRGAPSHPARGRSSGRPSRAGYPAETAREARGSE